MKKNFLLLFILLTTSNLAYSQKNDFYFEYSYHSNPDKSIKHSVDSKGYVSDSYETTEPKKLTINQLDQLKKYIENIDFFNWEASSVNPPENLSDEYILIRLNNNKKKYYYKSHYRYNDPHKEEASGLGMIVNQFLWDNEEKKWEDECIAKGGTWTPPDPHFPSGCRIEYSDAEKECTSSSQCEGSCITNVKSNIGVKGFCQKTSNSLGGPCHTPIEESELMCTWQGDIRINCYKPTAEHEINVCASYKKAGIWKE